MKEKSDLCPRSAIRTRAKAMQGQRTDRPPIAVSSKAVKPNKRQISSVVWNIEPLTRLPLSSLVDDQDAQEEKSPTWEVTLDELRS